ncbi:MAG TPA: monofunctional biosynthetic peptidoglycan transglycosylase [Caulobacteraceae bacterium]
MPAHRPPQRPGGAGGFARRLLATLIVLLLILPLAAVVIYRFVPPPITLLMVERLLHGEGLDHRWTPLSRISPTVIRAVIASEDSRFCEHHGFDVLAIESALRHNRIRPGGLRGGSTISQQTAKNVFLWPERSWLRKGFEAYFTVLTEAIWGKRRIMEVYLNTIELGPGVYGVAAASDRYFGAGSSRLTPAQAARLAAIIPSPLKWKAEDPGPYVRRRTGRIVARAGTVRRDALATCVLD